MLGSISRWTRVSFGLLIGGALTLGLGAGGSFGAGARVTGAAPKNTALPVVSGAARQGLTLTASRGVWKNAPTSFGYQWRRCNTSGSGCSNIAGAKRASYVLRRADVGRTLRAVVSAKNARGVVPATSRHTPPVASAAMVSAGFSHTCAVLSSGAPRCWGSNASGELGNGSLASSATPVTVIGIATATAISAGGDHTCAQLASGQIKCWGKNTSGQLGNGTLTGATAPVGVIGIP